jgi:hypothetical protein
VDVAYASVRNKNYDIWLMGRRRKPACIHTSAADRDGAAVLQDGSFIRWRREENRTVRQVLKADLATGAVTPLTVPDLTISGFAVAPAGDLSRWSCR